MDWPVDRFEFAAGPADAGPGFEVANPRGSAEALLICDHASRLIPRDLNALGLGCGLLAGHIAWDIGAAQVTRHLAELLDTAAVLSAISRLVIDCNRPLDDPRSKLVLFLLVWSIPNLARFDSKGIKAGQIRYMKELTP